METTSMEKHTNRCEESREHLFKVVKGLNAYVVMFYSQLVDVYAPPHIFSLCPKLRRYEIVCWDKNWTYDIWNHKGGSLKIPSLNLSQVKKWVNERLPETITKAELEKWFLQTKNLRNQPLLPTWENAYPEIKYLSKNAIVWKKGENVRDVIYNQLKIKYEPKYSRRMPH